MRTVRKAAIVGIAYSEMLDMDVRTFDEYVNGYTLRREECVNDLLDIGHAVAGKIAMAVWGSREFKRPFERVRLFVEKDVVTYANEKVIGFLKRKGLI